MKLLRVIATLNPAAGGPIEGLRQSARLHAEWGHRTEVATVDPPDASWLKSDHFTAHGLGPGKFGWAWSAGLKPWLAANLSRFDRVFVHGLWLYPSCATINALNQIRKSGRSAPEVFVFPHGMLDPWFQSWRRRPLKTARNFAYWKLVERHVIEGADAVLFTSEQERLLACTTFRPYRARREVVVPYGAAEPPPPSHEQSAAFRERCPSLGDRPYLLFLSRLHPKKGVDLLIQAYVERVRQSPDTSELPDLVIAGPGLDTAFGNKLLNLARQSDLSVSVAGAPAASPHSAPYSPLPTLYFPGMLQGDAKWRAFHGCEAFILPSHQENFGIVVAEALGCGKPVLISDQVNIWREIDSAEAGIVKPDTPEGVTALLHEWLSIRGTAQADRMGVKALELFHSNYTATRAAQALLEL